MQAFIEEVKHYAVFILLGVFGGVAYQLLSKSHRVTRADLLRGGVISGFAGLMAGILSDQWGLGKEAAYLLSGMFGFAGGVGLILLFAAIMKKFHISPDEVVKLADTMNTCDNTEYVGRTLPQLVAEGVLDRCDYSMIMCGDIIPLMRIHEEGKITDEEVHMIMHWLYLMTKQRVQEEAEAEEAAHGMGA